MKKILFVLLCCVNTVIAQYVPTNGLIAYYPMKGNANDSSGNNYHLTVNGPVLTKDRFGRPNHAYQFDGINDYLSYNTILPQGSNFTFSFWYLSDTLFQRGDIFFNGSMGASGLGVMQNGGSTVPAANNPGDKISFLACGVSYYFSVQTNANTWHHVVIRISGNTYDFFYDNLLINSGTLSYIPPSGKFCLGYNPFLNNDPFKGRIDDVILYNRALSVPEIDTLFHGCKQQITGHPSNLNAIESGTAIFTVASSTVGANYQWQMDGGTGYVNLSNSGSFSGTNSDTLKISNVPLSLNNNHFRAIVTNDVACNDTSAGAKLVITPASVQQLNSDNALIYPNPSNGNFHIDLSRNNKIVSYQIFNSMGQELQRGSLTPNQLNQVQFLANRGFYVLRLVGENASMIEHLKIAIE